MSLRTKLIGSCAYFIHYNRSIIKVPARFLVINNTPYYYPIIIRASNYYV